MEDEREKLKLSFIYEVHSIAKSCPEMLEEILTDEVLVWCLTDIDKNLSRSIDISLGFEDIVNSPDYDSSKKSMCRALLNSTKRELKEYYDLFLVYDNIRKKRNISLDYNLTIDKYILDLQHILGQDINNKSVSRK